MLLREPFGASPSSLLHALYLYHLPCQLLGALPFESQPWFFPEPYAWIECLFAPSAFLFAAIKANRLDRIIRVWTRFIDAGLNSGIRNKGEKGCGKGQSMADEQERYESPLDISLVRTFSWTHYLFLPLLAHFLLLPLFQPHVLLSLSPSFMFVASSSLSCMRIW